MGESLTVQQVLQICMDQLNEIQIPVGQMNTVGSKIQGVVRNLGACVEAINMSKEEPKDEREADAE